MGIRTRLELRLASPPLAIWQYRDVTFHCVLIPSATVSIDNQLGIP